MGQKVSNPEMVHLAIEHCECPVGCTAVDGKPLTFKDRTAARDHMRSYHDMLVGSKRGGSRPASPRVPVVEGERVVIGAAPAEVVRVIVECGNVRRVIETWVVPMGDVFDLCAGAIRQAIPGPRR